MAACINRAPTVCSGLEDVMEIHWVCSAGHPSAGLSGSLRPAQSLARPLPVVWLCVCSQLCWRPAQGWL